jgi:hypothetical protein
MSRSTAILPNAAAAASFVVLILLLGCGGGSGSSDSGGGGNNPPPTSGQNVQPITVDAGPAGDYANGAFTNVTVCVPNTSNCQTLTGVLVDTGSSGLRILSSALTLSLPQQKDGNGNIIAECTQFQDGFTWGPVQTADIKVAGEQANAVPVQVIGPPNLPVAPACTNTGLTSEDNLQALGANGILGVGSFRQDCGPACAVSGSQNPGLYFACPSSGCVTTAVSTSNQLQNPVWLFANDNNGSAIQLPSVPVNGSAPVSGSLVFGIGTQSNNDLGNATVFTLNTQGEFTTIFNSNSVTGFIDSGSNGIYFLTSSATGIPTCTGSKNASSFYCPTSTLNLSATNRGSNGATNTVKFSVANANNLFTNPVFTAFAGLAGPNPGFFDWGLPFFYGRTVFSAIELQSTPAGLGPYWAY